MTAVAGTRFGRYEIRSPLGKGGMGEVYLAQDMQLDRTVALKMLSEKLASDQRQLRRFVQEAKAASALNHPNIITIHEIGEENSVPFISTEFIDGVTLRQLISDTGITLRETFDIVLQVGSALTAAHAAGIVHRDIKPENIMLRRDGYVKVLDFGLAKLTERESGQQASDPEAPTRPAAHTDPGMVVGTVIYMSPEQARGLLVDARTDIWSFGVVLYEMITGHLPLGGATTSDVIAAILEREPPPLVRYAPQAPPELERIVSKALAKDAEERYQTVKDLLIDLRRLKRQLDTGFELENTLRPGATGQGATLSSSERAVMETVQASAVETSRSKAPHTSSNAEYLVGEIKRHKRGVIAALIVLVAIAAGVAYLLFSGKTPINSILVLPFDNKSGDTGLEELSDGISESLINDLSNPETLRVVAKNTAFSHKGQSVEAQKIGSALNVRAVLLGSVSKRGDTLIVKTELIDVENDSHLWGGEFEIEHPDLIGPASISPLQKEFAKQIFEKLREKLAVKGQN